MAGYRRVRFLSCKRQPDLMPRLDSTELACLSDIVQSTVFPLDKLEPLLSALSAYVKTRQLVLVEQEYDIGCGPVDKTLTVKVGYRGQFDVWGSIKAPAMMDTLPKEIHLPPELDEKVRQLLMVRDSYIDALDTIQRFTSKLHRYTAKQVVGLCPELLWILHPQDLKGRATTRPVIGTLDATEVKQALTFVKLMGGLP